MATSQIVPETALTVEQENARLLVLLTPMPEDQLQAVVTHLAEAFSPSDLVVAAPEPLPQWTDAKLQMIAVPGTRASWTLTAADFAHAHQLAQEHDPKAVLLLGPESSSMQAEALSNLAQAVLESPNDLAVPCYEVPARTGLINSAILYPLSRALFAARPRFPLAIDLAFSPRMAARLGNAAQRFLNLNQSEAPLWPLNEAAVAGFAVTETRAGKRATPQPADPDLHTILPIVAGSLFADIEAKAAFWQRPRQAPPTRGLLRIEQAEESAADTSALVQAFRLGYTNLQEIWSLVLPPNAMLGLKRLVQEDAPQFKMPDTLWARIVYDFLLAWRLRTIHRGHLMGALVPLYLAWVAGHLHSTAGGTTPEQHIEAVATAFEAEKPYLVSRWRWPDRFNP